MTRRYRVRWAQAARRDALAIFAYLLDESPEAAARFLDGIERRASSLASLPLRGRVVPELARFHIRSYRELQAPPYRIIYRVGDSVFVLGVFDARRNLEDALLERLLRDTESEGA